MRIPCKVGGEVSSYPKKFGIDCAWEKFPAVEFCDAVNFCNLICMPHLELHASNLVNISYMAERASLM